MENTTKTSSLSPRFFFVSLGVLVTLITSVSSYLVLFFETLNKKFPDILNTTYTYGYNSYNFETIRASLAILIIFFPVFLCLIYFWRKIMRSDLSFKDGIIFKWMIYLIIFLSSLVVAIDLVTLVKYFVSGEITSRFIFKVSGVIIVAGLIGFYYFYELRSHNDKFNNKIHSLISFIVSIIIFLGLVIWSFSVMGSPKEQRALRLDEKRINDLQDIQYQVVNYWQQKEKLPTRLVDLDNPISGYSLPTDPEFEKGLKYEYNLKSDLVFELCATFTADMPQGWQEGSYSEIRPMYKEMSDVVVSSSYPYPGGTNDSWDHGVGYTCFERVIDKDLYPVFKK